MRQKAGFAIVTQTTSNSNLEDVFISEPYIGISGTLSDIQEVAFRENK